MKHSLRLGVGSVFVVLALLALVGCGSGQTTHASAPTSTSARPTPTTAVTPTPGIARVPYPWPMKATTTSFGTTVYRPADAAVTQEMQADFLTYWAWSGYAKPAVVLHFVPDATQIPRLATSNEVGQLRAYVEQIESSGQLVTYAGQQLIQNITGCTQNGLQCTNLYAFGLTVKTVYSTRDGSILTTASNFIATVSIQQDYNQELQLWQVGSVQVNEITG